MGKRRAKRDTEVCYNFCFILHFCPLSLNKQGMGLRVRKPGLIPSPANLLLSAHRQVTSASAVSSFVIFPPKLWTLLSSAVFDTELVLSPTQYHHDIQWVIYMLFNVQYVKLQHDPAQKTKGACASYSTLIDCT